MEETCSCSYGEWAVGHCIEGDLCAETGGYQRTMLDAFYMSRSQLLLLEGVFNNVHSYIVVFLMMCTRIRKCF